MNTVKTTVGMASFPPRRAGMIRRVQELLPQCDKMVVYLNGYTSRPPELPQSPKLEVILAGPGTGNPDLGSHGKFAKLDECDGIYLSVDDDILYPHGYVAHMVNELNKFPACVVGAHGTVFASPNKVIPYWAANTAPRTVHKLGCGVAAFYPKKIGVTFNGTFSGEPGSGDDEDLALWAHAKDIPLVRIVTSAGFVRADDAIWSLDPMHRRQSYIEARNIKMAGAAGWKIPELPGAITGIPQALSIKPPIPKSKRREEIDALRAARNARRRSLARPVAAPVNVYSRNGMPISAKAPHNNHQPQCAPEPQLTPALDMPIITAPHYQEDYPRTYSEYAHPEPIITVSMSTYRTSAALLRRAVMGVLNQTEERIRLLVVNDGAESRFTDPLRDITDKRLVIVDLPNNHGTYHVHASTLAACDTEWWTPHDADDWTAPSRLKDMLAASTDKDAVFNSICVVKNTGELKRWTTTKWGGNTTDLLPYEQWSALWKTEWLKLIGGPHPDFRVGYDTLLSSIAALAGRITTVTTPMYYYHTCAGSLTTAPATSLNSPYRKQVAKKLTDMWRACGAAYIIGGAKTIGSMITSTVTPESEASVAADASRIRRACEEVLNA